ncbi:MAG TPA: hypothetical protein VFO34_07795 [Candidatus Acidoferrales bacterium]|nr:hypothetical protein [Candidatus Acidoferrales bacterium]
MKKTPLRSSLKKAIVERMDGATTAGYVNPAGLGHGESFDLLTEAGEHQSVAMEEVRSIYFVGDFKQEHRPARTTFLSRPKLDGLWVRLQFRDGELLEGVVPNDLLGLLDSGVQIIPPDLSGNTQRIFIPRSALEEMKVLGVIGVARRKAAAAEDSGQPKLFSE